MLENIWMTSNHPISNLLTKNITPLQCVSLFWKRLRPIIFPIVLMCLHVRFMPQKLLTRVNYVKLFNLLLERNLPGVIIWLLFESYSRRFVYTRWNSALSDPIPTENWVKPGGVLSPMLLCKYFDDLLNRMERTGIDHHIGHHFYGGLGCADDVIALPYVDCISDWYMLNIRYWERRYISLKKDCVHIWVMTRIFEFCANSMPNFRQTPWVLS